MNGAPKNRENVDPGSATPVSVPASLLVYPMRNHSFAWSGSRRARGGRTPLASAVRRIIAVGCPASPCGSALRMKDRGYEAREFSVNRRSRKSNRPSGVMNAFSTIAPCSSGSASCITAQ